MRRDVAFGSRGSVAVKQRAQAGGEARRWLASFAAAEKKSLAEAD